MTTNAEHGDDRSDWRARPILLAVFGAAAALVVEDYLANAHYFDASIWRYAVAMFVGVFAALIGFTIERARPAWALGFAALCAGLMALITWSAGPSTSWGANAGWRLACGALAVAVATPLFQTWRDTRSGRARFPYGEVHGHAWTDVVLFLAAWAFAGVAVLLGMLIASLFRLIGVTALMTLMATGWFLAALIGAALGAAIGLLRERDRVLRTLLTVVLVVLRVLAPVLAAFLAAFLVFLPFTGITTLWSATRSTTPILLGCVAAALVLANAVIGQDDRDRARSDILQAGARLLSIAVLPLSVVAAVSLGLRVIQHGLSVDRLWALVAVGFASVYGVGYVASALRPGWIDRVRATNLRLAFVIVAVATVLALPIIGFERIATNDQVARLKSGRIAPDKFDWAALRFDFGEPGNVAVARLANSANPLFASAAGQALNVGDRYALREEQSARSASTGIDTRLRIVSASTPADAALRDAIARDGQCANNSRCALIVESPTRATLVTQSCRECEVYVQRYASDRGRWFISLGGEPTRTDTDTDGLRDALTQGRVDIRVVPRRQVFIGGRPVGEPFEMIPDGG